MGRGVPPLEEPNQALEELATDLTVEGIEARVISEASSSASDTLDDLVVIYLAADVDTLTNDTFEYCIERVIDIARRWAEAQVRKEAGDRGPLVDHNGLPGPGGRGSGFPAVPDHEVNAKYLAVAATEYMAVVLRGAIEWLRLADSVDAVRQAKLNFVGYEALIREKKLASEARLSAAECVRRCERRIGELVTKGQKEGAFRSKSVNVPTSAVTVGTIDHRARVSDYIAGGGKGYADYRVMASVDDDHFDLAVEEAKAEGNLSRANVVRKIKGASGPIEPREVNQCRVQPRRSRRIVVEFRRSDGSLLEGLTVEKGPGGLVTVTIEVAGADVPRRRPRHEMSEWLDEHTGRRMRPSRGVHHEAGAN
jgi:hypothetical protein